VTMHTELLEIRGKLRRPVDRTTMRPVWFRRVQNIRTRRLFFFVVLNVTNSHATTSCVGLPVSINPCPIVDASAELRFDASVPPAVAMRPEHVDKCERLLFA